MTTAHVEKFAELVAKDPALLAKLGLDKVNADAAAAASAAAFITNAVKEAKAHGLEFTEEELNAFMAAERTAAGSGELSDTQLDAVSGGITNTSCDPLGTGAVIALPAYRPPELKSANLTFLRKLELSSFHPIVIRYDANLPRE